MMKKEDVAARIGVFIAGVMLGLALYFSVYKGGDKVAGELRDYEVVLEIKTLILNVEGGTDEAAGLAVGHMKKLTENNKAKISVVAVNDMGPSEKNAERKK